MERVLCLLSKLREGQFKSPSISPKKLYTEEMAPVEEFILNNSFVSDQIIDVLFLPKRRYYKSHDLNKTKAINP